MDRPWRLLDGPQQLYSDGWVGADHEADIVTASYNRFGTPGTVPARCLVTVSEEGLSAVTTFPEKVRIQIGTLALGQQRNGVLPRADTRSVGGL